LDPELKTIKIKKQQNMTFKEKFEAEKEKYGKPNLYNRFEAYKLLGFKNSKALTDWLRDNEFMSYDDYPDNYVIEKGIMDYTMKHISPRSRYDENGYDIGRWDYDGSSNTKSFAVPLFTVKGIQYFKNLLVDPEELKKISEEIKSQNQYYSIPIK